jgi:microcystin-dependent protein
VGFSTGDVKMTLKTVADSGWIMMGDGTIGSAASSATYANAAAQALFTLLWNNVSDTYAPVTSGRGASAVADWAANKRIALTKVLGRALAVAGGGSGLSSRALGATVGEEAHVLTTGELAVHSHGVSDPQHTHGVSDPGHTHQIKTGNDGYDGGAANDASNENRGANTSAASTTGVTVQSAYTGVTIQNSGSDTAHNNMQPTTFLNVMIKL